MKPTNIGSARWLAVACAEASCESPIERILLRGLCAYIDGACGAAPIEFVHRGKTVAVGCEPDSWAKDTTLVVEIQPDLIGYRPDFVVSVRLAGPGPVVSSNRVVVECDGHDFHERTKEQARHDRRKDRALQRAGFVTLRFTGSEIYADADECAREIVEVLTNPRTNPWLERRVG